LIEAALVTEKRVVALDDAARKHLRDLHAELPEVRSICWVNLSAPNERAIAWLNSGAPADKFRMLGYPRRKLEG
jgi:hypothetical protein